MKPFTKKKFITHLVVFLLMSSTLPCTGTKSVQAVDFVDYVDPWIESNKSRFFFFASACRPFGMMNLSPDSRSKGAWKSGYHHGDSEILGFSHVHAWMLSGITVMPISGSVNPTEGVKGWRSGKDTSKEIVQPGYHKVRLDKYAIGVELTSTDRVGFYRMTHEKSGVSKVLFNLSGHLGQSNMRDSYIKKVSDTELEGFVTMTGRIWGPNKIRIYFVARFDKPFSDLKGWKGKSELGSITKTDGDGIGAFAEHPVKAGERLQMKIAISYTGIANARLNLQTELDHWDFDKVKQESRDVWNEWLGKIEVKGGTRDQRVKFYTDLWHVLLGRRKLNDTNGMYPDNTAYGIFPNQKESARTVIRQLPLNPDGSCRYNFYNSDAFWLTQWNINLVWGMAYPQVLNEFVKRSGNWKNLFHPEHKLIFSRDKDGKWRHTNPLSGRHFVEANSSQATWSVSHDLAGLAELMGGRDAFCDKLNSAFEQAVDQKFVSGYGKGTVSYANQPGCSNAHVFNYAGKPWLSQYWVRQVNEKAYGGVTPELGYGGHDEDQGQMGGVSVLMSMGLFSVKGTCSQDPVYEITSPVFDSVTIHLDQRYYPGKTFRITTINNSRENMYIQSARLNSKGLNKVWFYHRELAAGGHLEITLGPRPNTAWGVDTGDTPHFN